MKEVKELMPNDSVAEINKVLNWSFSDLEIALIQGLYMVARPELKEIIELFLEDANFHDALKKVTNVDVPDNDTQTVYNKYNLAIESTWAIWSQFFEENREHLSHGAWGIPVADAIWKLLF